MFFFLEFGKVFFILFFQWGVVTIRYCKVFKRTINVINSNLKYFQVKLKCKSSWPFLNPVHQNPSI